jgi:hypothetical protein
MSFLSSSLVGHHELDRFSEPIGVDPVSAEQLVVTVRERLHRLQHRLNLGG